MRPLARAGQVWLTDGALGTEYQRLGIPPGSCADLLNLHAPDKVYLVTRSYIEAGSDVVLTTTFRANRIALATCGYGAAVAPINRTAARIARAAAGDRPVLGDAGPSGRMPGEIGESELFSTFSEQCDALAEGGVDGIVFETFSDLGEARIALAAAQRTGLPVVVSFAFDTRKASFCTMTGLTPERAAAEMTTAGAYAVGGNCSTGFDASVEICRRLNSATTLPVWIKPNAGVPEIVAGRATYAATPDEFAAYVVRYAASGATFVGGCCGTNPDFIRAASAALRTLKERVTRQPLPAPD